MKSTSCRDVEIRRSTAAMHLRQFMSGKIDMNVGQLCTSIHRSTNGGQFAAVSFGGKRSGASARASSPLVCTRAAKSRDATNSLAE